MTELQIFAFYIMPVLVVALGVGAAWLNNWDVKRKNRLHPGE